MAMSTWVLAVRYVHYETGEAELYHIDYRRQCAGRRPATGATADADADAAEEVRNLLAATGEATAEQQAKYGEIASRCMEIPVIFICAQREYFIFKSCINEIELFLGVGYAQRWSSTGCAMLPLAKV